jgi:hypothetical protein
MVQRIASRFASRTRAAILGGSAVFLFAAPVAAQNIRFAVQPELSLAWWQVNPHLGHLWATTCPGDPSWRAGEGVSMAQAKSIATNLAKRTGHSAIVDTVVPLYPRRRVRPVCAEGVSGEITATDTVNWRGVRGNVVVQVEALQTGLKMRDEFARDNVLAATRHPTASFRIDSLANVQPGDTLQALAVGVLSIRGIDQALRVPVKAWREAGGLRVMGRMDLPAKDLIDRYQVSKWALGLGVTGAIWKTLHLGIDVVLKPTTASPTPQ